MANLKKLLFAVIAACLLQAPAYGQANQQPSDISSYSEPTPTYEDGTDPNVLGDGSNDWGGTPAAYATMPADIATPSRSTWITAGSYADCPGDAFCSGTQPKMRLTVSNSGFIAFDDPIRNFNDPGGSHCHIFFGSQHINAWSTYASLRRAPNSASQGGPLNNTGYWIPCPIITDPFSDGKNYVVKMDWVAVYYEEGTNAESAYLVRIPRGMRYVTGVNMDDPDNTGRAAEVATANAQAGTSGRYTLKENGKLGYLCYNASGTLIVPKSTSANTPLRPNHSKYLKEPDGDDPWEGNCTTGGAGAGGGSSNNSVIIAELAGPDCWNGVDLWVPGGYDHTRHKIGDNTVGGGAGTVCPDNWYRLPRLILKIAFSHKGFADYGRWRLSSDDMMEDKLTTLGTPRTVGNGESLHSDWFGAWDDETMVAWMTGCTGADSMSGTPRECNGGVFTATDALVSGSPANYNIATSHFTDDPANMFQLPDAPGGGPVDIHIHD